MQVIIDHNSMIPIYEQLISKIKNAILTGDLKEGEQLPSVRSLAKDLRISALTVKKSYNQLETDGLIATVQGKGSYVLPVNQQAVQEESLKEIQEEMEKIKVKAQDAHISEEDLLELFKLILEE